MSQQSASGGQSNVTTFTLRSNGITKQCQSSVTALQIFSLVTIYSPQVCKEGATCFSLTRKTYMPFAFVSPTSFRTALLSVKYISKEQK